MLPGRPPAVNAHPYNAPVRDYSLRFAAPTLALAGLAAFAVSQGIGRFAMTPILPMMQEEGLSLSQGGWLAASNYLGYLVGALWTIWLNIRPSLAIRTALG